MKNQIRKKVSLIRQLKLWGILFIIAVGGSLIAFDIIRSHMDFNSRAALMRSDYIADQKNKVKREVERAVDLINFKRMNSRNQTKQKIKFMVNKAYGVAQNIYYQNKNKNRKEIEQMIVEALRFLRFGMGNGYMFITDFDGISVLFSDKPEIEGSSMLDMQDTKGKFVIRDMIEIAKNSGEGFYEYHWSKPGLKGNDFKKTSFIKTFDPYDWYIGTGLYSDDIIIQTETDLLLTISKIRFDKEGYIFINRLNGDALVSNGKLYSGIKKLWEVFNKDPEKTKELFDKEYKAALKPEGDFIYYSFIKLSSSKKESPKVSYIFGLPELNWLIGAGVYLDDIEEDINLMQSILKHQIKIKTIYFIFIVFGLLLIFFFFINLLTNRLKNDYIIFSSFFNKTVSSSEEVDRDQILFLEFDKMAVNANRMRTNLRNSEENYRDLFNDNPIALWEEDFSEVKTILDRIKKKGAKITKNYLDEKPDVFNECRSVISISNINKATLELLDYKDLETLEKNNDSVLNNKTLETIKNEFIAIANDEKYFSEESELVRSDGKVLDVIVHFQVIGTYKRVLFSITDISNLKKIENALMKSERHFRILMEQSPISIQIYNKDGILMNANQSWMDLWDIEDMGNVLGTFNILEDPQLYEKGDIDEFKKAFAGEKIFIPESEFNPADSGYSARNRIVKVIAYPLKDTDGSIDSIVVLQEDITNQKKMEEELKKIQMLKSVGTLAGGIAHDFNNILMGLFGNISLAKMKLSKNHPSLGHLEEAEKSMNWATGLTKQLLTFSKGGSPVKEDISIGRLIEDVVKFDLSGSNVKPVFSIAEDLWLAEVDKGQTQQMFSNLTINANQAMPDGGQLFITVENADIKSNIIPGLNQGMYIKVNMRDEGTGIDQKHIERIFDPYFSTKQTGSGLGLATVYSIISKHGGHISIDSDLGKGTEFILYLPASKSQKLHVNEDPLNKPDIIEKRGKVLLMDDETTVCEVTSQMLEALGFSFEIANDGKKAIEIYKRSKNIGEPFDAVIMDLTIPGGLGGKETLKELLLIDPEVKAIVSSGYADDPVMANFSDFGFKGILGKPYIMKSLRDVLNRVLD